MNPILNQIMAIFGVLFTIVFFHELGHFIAAKLSKVEVLEFGIGFPPRIFAFRFKGTDYSLNSIFFGAFVKLAGEKEESVQGGFYAKSPLTRFIVGAAGPIINVLLAFALFTFSFIIPSNVVVGGEGIKVFQVASGSPAADSGIQTEDLIQKIAGKEVKTPDEVHDVIKANLGQETEFLLLRAGNEVPVHLTPRVNPPRGEGAIGIRLSWAQVKTERRSLALGPALLESGKTMIQVPELLRQFFSQVFTSPEATLMGPIGAAQITGQVAKFGLGPLIALAASLSIGIAVFNFFPIPPLDGGGMAISIVEGFRRGRSISKHSRTIIYAIGTILLVMLFVMITYNDIMRLIRGDNILP